MGAIFGYVLIGMIIVVSVGSGIEPHLIRIGWNLERIAVALEKISEKNEGSVECE